MTRILLALLLSVPAAAQTSVDACRTGRALEARPLRLHISPTDGSAPIELLLRFTGCSTTERDPYFGDDTAPTALRTFRAPGVAWEVHLYTEDGRDTTELYVYYAADKNKAVPPAGYFRPVKTAAVALGRVDWGKGKLMNDSPPKFDFSAQVVTQ